MEFSYPQRFWRYARAVWLPLALAAFFALQNYLFNQWLGLFSGKYLLRLLWVSFSLGLILFGPALLFKKRSKYLYLCVMAFLVALILATQFMFFQYGKSFWQVSAVAYIGQALAIKGTAKGLLSPNLLLFFGGFGLVVVVWIIEERKNFQEIILLQKEKLAAMALIAVIAFGGYYFLFSQEKREWGSSSRLYKDVYDLNSLVQKIGIVNFTLEDAFKYAVRTNLVNAADKTFLEQWSKNQAAQKPGKYFGIDKGKNIIFIQIESLENAVINQSINGQEITPNLNALAKEGLYFSNYYTQVGPGNTADAEFSTLNSLYPLQDDVVFVDYAQNHYNALPQLLVKNGYSASALHGDVPTFWNRSNMYPNLGYQEQISEDNYVESRPIGKGPSPLGDEDFLLQSLPKMESFKQPFFSTLITESSHTPFELPDDLQTLDLSGHDQLDYTQQQYLQSIHYMDKALGEFMDGLKKEPWFKNSVIAIYGDHGSYTGIADVVGNEDKTFLGLTHSQVPLIILNSGIKNQEVIAPASHLDLFPTIANLAGVTPPKDILGQDIFNAKDPLVVLRNIGSGTINTIKTQTLAFVADSDGVFGHGTCVKLPEKSPLPVADCKDIYEKQSDTVKASDIIVRGNLLDLFLASVKH